MGTSLGLGDKESHNHTATEVGRIFYFQQCQVEGIFPGLIE